MDISKLLKTDSAMFDANNIKRTVSQTLAVSFVHSEPPCYIYHSL